MGGVFDQVIEGTGRLLPRPNTPVSRLSTPNSARTSVSRPPQAEVLLPDAETEDSKARRVVRHPCSDDDCSEFDDVVAPNQLLANIVSMSRKKERWQMELGHGLLLMGGVELLFASAEVSLEL